MSTVATWLWAIVGVDVVDRRETEERFRRSLRDHEDADENLDDILSNLRRINTKASRQVDLNKTMLPCMEDHDTPVATEVG